VDGAIAATDHMADLTAEISRMATMNHTAADTITITTGVVIARVAATTQQDTTTMVEPVAMEAAEVMEAVITKEVNNEEEEVVSQDISRIKMFSNQLRPIIFCETLTTSIRI